MIESPMLSYLEQQLTVSAKRQQVLSANIANVDTPGYRAQDVTFDKQMELLDLERTSARHIPLKTGAGIVRSIDAGTKVKSNGNSVDLDRELIEVTKNGLEFVTLMQFLQSKLRTIRSSITDGGRV